MGCFSSRISKRAADSCNFHLLGLQFIGGQDHPIPYGSKLDNFALKRYNLSDYPVDLFREEYTCENGKTDADLAQAVWNDQCSKFNDLLYHLW